MRWRWPLALFDPRLEVVAVTATAGNVSADQSQSQRTGDHRASGPVALPARRLGDRSGRRCRHEFGRICTARTGWATRDSWCRGMHHRHPIRKGDLRRRAVGSAQRHAGLPGAVDQRGAGVSTRPGSAHVGRSDRDDRWLGQRDRRCHGGGGIQHALRFANSARTVFQVPVTKTLIPLDVTRSLKLTLDLLGSAAQ